VDYSNFGACCALAYAAYGEGGVGDDIEDALADEVGVGQPYPNESLSPSVSEISL
jgi:hypothetical protein